MLDKTIPPAEPDRARPNYNGLRVDTVFPNGSVIEGHCTLPEVARRLKRTLDGYVEGTNNADVRHPLVPCPIQP